MYTITPFFSSFNVDVLENLDPKYIDEIHKLKTTDNSSVKFSNTGGWQSPTYGYYSLLEFVPLLDILKSQVKEVYLTLGVDKDPSMVGYWFNSNRRYNYNVAHTHGGSYISGVLYFKVPKNSGNIIFTRPDPLRQWIVDATRLTEANTGSYTFSPVPGMMVLFPSYITHYVDQNLCEDEDDERISMAFNFR